MTNNEFDKLKKAQENLFLSIAQALRIDKFVNWMSKLYYFRELTEGDMVVLKKKNSVFTNRKTCIGIISEDEGNKVLLRRFARDRYLRTDIRRVYPWDFFKIVNERYKL